jgi:hypothetical protein
MRRGFHRMYKLTARDLLWFLLADKWKRNGKNSRSDNSHSVHFKNEAPIID